MAIMTLHYYIKWLHRIQQWHVVTKQLGYYYVRTPSDHLHVWGERFGQINANHHQAVYTYRTVADPGFPVGGGMHPLGGGMDL